MAAKSWNKVELMGNLTRDPELRYTPSGAAVCTFSVATNRTFVSDGERKEEADFHRCVAWNKLAELCNQLLKKGNRVFVSGRLQNRSWEGQDGQPRQTTEIVVEDMILLTPKAGSGEEASIDMVPAEVVAQVEPPASPEPAAASEEKGTAETEPKPQEAKPDESVSDEDLPF